MIISNKDIPRKTLVTALDIYINIININIIFITALKFSDPRYKLSLRFKAMTHGLTFQSSPNSAGKSDLDDLAELVSTRKVSLRYTNLFLIVSN